MYSLLSWLVFVIFVFFFFSSRRRHTRFDCDWSSDVCSSDLFEILGIREAVHFRGADKFRAAADNHVAEIRGLAAVVVEAGKARWAFAAAYERSEERRVGKECRSGWRREHEREKGEKDVIGGA